MARPRKLSTGDLVRIVESCYENCGDHSQLKFSVLEEYALSIGIEVKAYDFRRNPEVRQRIEALQGMPRNDIDFAVAYKSLDVDAFISRNRKRESLKCSLMELDESWRRVYEKSAEISARNTRLSSEALIKDKEIRGLKADSAKQVESIGCLERRINELTLENRYLRNALKTYLYPAVANEILMDERVLQQTDTSVSPSAMRALADTSTPDDFPSSVAHDNRIISREEELLARMAAGIYGGTDETQ